MDGISVYPRTSRYHGVETTTDSRGTPHLRRRLLPRPSVFVAVSEHVVNEGDRLDSLAFRYLGDPEQWWRIADANPGLDLDALAPGTRILITLPEGVPGNG